MILGIEHTAICSPEPHALADWYADVLGFKVNYRSSGTSIVRGPNGFMIEITTAEGERAAAGEKSPGLRHMAVAVTEFAAEVARLREKNVAFLAAPFENKGNRIVFFTDPEGNILHLLQRVEPLPDSL